MVLPWTQWLGARDLLSAVISSVYGAGDLDCTAAVDWPDDVLRLQLLGFSLTYWWLFTHGPLSPPCSSILLAQGHPLWSPESTDIC